MVPAVSQPIRTETEEREPAAGGVSKWGAHIFK